MYKKLAIAALSFWLLLCSLATRAEALNQEVFKPQSGKGPVVIVMSGSSGPEALREYASKVASLGYYTVLIDGREILSREKDGLGNLRRVIEETQSHPEAVNGKVAVVGFSQGGGGAILHAATLAELVSMVVAYYPAISWAPNMGWLAGRISVPVLVLAGEKDRQNDCCLIESMRSLEAAAKARKLPFELVTYPEAEHALNSVNTGQYRPADANDAWRRTTAMLFERHPIGARQ